MKNGNWNDTYDGDENAIVDHLLYDIKLAEFDLDEAKFNRIVFSYPTWSRIGKTKNDCQITIRTGRKTFPY
jgi:hypothetical protein